jgi:hypothetical protein
MKNPEEPAQIFIKTADAMRENLRIRDSFGGRRPLAIKDIKYASMQDVSLSTTFESIRHAMIIAFADQMAKVHSLKLHTKEDGTKRGSAKDIERQQDSRTLTDKANRSSSRSMLWLPMPAHISSLPSFKMPSGLLMSCGR